MTATVKNFTVDVGIILEQEMACPINHYKFGRKKSGDPNWEKKSHELQ